MAQETITIYKVDTTEAVKNIQDLKDNISAYKEKLKEADIGSTDYQKTLKNLQENQAALRNAMYGTSASMEDISAAAKGTGNSYNALVKRMADLKQELRATDVSTEAGRRSFENLAAQIKTTNDRLKEMDEMQGNYGRNVGNYTNSIKEAVKGLGNIDKVGGDAAKSVKKMNDAFKVMAANPIIFALTALLKVADMLKKSFDQNEEATQALKTAMEPLTNVTKVVSKVMDTLATALAKVVTKVSEFIQRIAPKMISKLQDWAGTEKEVTAVVEDEAEKRYEARKREYQRTESILADLEKILDRYEKRAERLRTQHEKDAAEITKEIEDEAKVMAAEIDFLVTAMNADFLGAIQEQLDAEREAAETEAEILARRKEGMVAWAEAVPSILNSIADADEKHAGLTKVLKIAAATVDTIEGATKAFMSSAANPIAAAAKAAVVTAAGVANIAKMKAVKVGKSTGASASVPTITAAPSVSTTIPQVRNLTTAREEDRLNQMASDQRVVLVMSDIEVKQNQVRVQTAESSF